MDTAVPAGFQRGSWKAEIWGGGKSVCIAPVHCIYLYGSGLEASGEWPWLGKMPPVPPTSLMVPQTRYNPLCQMTKWYPSEGTIQWKVNYCDFISQNFKGNTRFVAQKIFILWYIKWWFIGTKWKTVQYSWVTFFFKNWCSHRKNFTAFQLMNIN